MKLTDSDFTSFKKASSIFRAINHQLRRKLYDFISEKERNVTELYVHFRLEQSVASQHLAILRKAGWVETFREGKYIFYKVNQEQTRKYTEATGKLVK